MTVGADRRFPWGRSPIVWFRPSIRKHVWRSWLWASLWVSLGAAILGALRVARVDFGSAWLPVYALGLGLVMAGPWQLLVGLSRLGRIERVLSVHEQGVRWEDGAVVAHITWRELDRIEIADDHLTLVTETARFALPPRFEDIEAAALAAMLGDMRRKALLGLPVKLTRVPDRV
jgi:hypothetical protein